jgi:hypothetical protein
MKLSLSAILVLISVQSFASTGAGNGGDAVVCDDGTITLLDSYEATKLGFNIDIDKVAKAKSLRAYVGVAVKRLASRDKYLAKKLYNYSMEMVNDFEAYKIFSDNTGNYKGEAIYISPDIVGEISDSEHRTLPVGCEARQLVSQLKPERLRDNRYEFNSTLWNQLSLLDQSMTILHEAWYRVMIEDGAKKSVGTRYMNALIASSDFSSYTFSDYIKELKKTEKKNYIIENNSSLIFDRTLKLDLKTSNFVFNGEEVCIDGITIRANIKKLAFIGAWHRGLATVDFTDVCFTNSALRTITMPTKISNKRINFVMVRFLLRSRGLEEEAAVLTFNTNGTLKQIKGLEFEALYKMFYVCVDSSGSEFRSDIRQNNCKGPYLNHKSKVKQPKSVVFDSNEKPIGFF